VSQSVVRLGLVILLTLLACLRVQPAVAQAVQAVQGVVVDDQNLSRVSAPTVHLVQVYTI